MRVAPAVSVQGDIAVPSIKGVCQRGVLFGAIAEGESEIRNFGRAADTESAISVARQLGADAVWTAPEVVRVHGVGLRGLRDPGGPLDCGNAGTVLRLTAGILAGQGGEFTLVGDESLSSRDQTRIAIPLTEMGAQVETSDGRAPVTIRGGALRPIRYSPPVASAQVKSAILLAGAVRGRRADNRGRGRADTRPHRADAARRWACASNASRARRASGRSRS